MLCNPVYKGVRTWAGREFPCDPLIDPQTWERAQAVTAARREARGTRTDPDDALCSALFKCECGRKYYFIPRRVARPKGRVEVALSYVCHGRSGGGKCRSKMINRDVLDSGVWAAVRGYLADPEAVIRASVQASGRIGQEVDSLDARESELQAVLGRIDSDVSDAWALQRAHGWPTSFVASRLDELNSERTATLPVLADLRRERAAKELAAEDASSVVQYLARVRAGLRDDLPNEKKRELIRLLVAGGTVRTTGEPYHRKAELTLRLRWGELVSAEVP